MEGRRWEDDERGRGAGDASAFVPGASELVAAMGAPAWVAEEPEAHLLPHLRRACEPLPLELMEAHTTADAAFEIDVRWTGEPNRPGEVREAVFALLGSIAESATYVRQRRPVPASDVDRPEPGGPLLFEIATGMIGDDAAFAPHGHTVRLRVDGVFER